MLWLLLSSVTASQAFAVDYNGGTYTNLCGTGHTANAHTCNAGCNTNSGSCSAPGEYVVKFVCDGRQGECRSNESGFSSYHSVGGVSCGKTVQIDVFNKNCRAGGGWSCGDNDLRDYIVWYSGDCQNNPPPQNPPSTDTNTCAAWMPVNTQMRVSGESSWVSGGEISNRNLKTGSKIDVNCFAKNGSTLLKDANIIARRPNGTEERVSTTGELRNFSLDQNGGYQFICRSTSLSSCEDSDSMFVYAQNPAICSGLSIVSGQDQTVPSTVRFRASGTDPAGNISEYRFHFGDGAYQQTTSTEIEHRYESSGSFAVRAYIKDARGQWITSDSCTNTVNVKPSNIESHRSDCSDLFITEGQDQQAPVTAKFNVTGFDNKGSLQQYKIDFGQGVVKEQSGSQFEQRFDQAGTYTIKAYVKDSKGEWKGGSGNCQRNLYVRTTPLTTQPKTGTPTDFTIFAITSGFIGSVMVLGRKKLAFLRR